MFNEDQIIISVKYMNGKGWGRTCGSKPVNINISFTINPKNATKKDPDIFDKYTMSHAAD